MRFVFAILWILAGMLATLAVLLLTDWPLGIPREWVWPRLPAHNGDATDLMPALMGAALFLTVAGIGGMRLLTSGVTRAETGVWLAVLAVATFAWFWCVQDTAATEGTLGKGPFVLYYPGASGYFTHARYREPDVAHFVAGYERLMREGDVLHIGTHPPGLFLFFYGLVELVQSFPPLEHWLHATQPESVRDAFDVIQMNTSHTAQRLEARDRAVLWLAQLVAQGCAAATVLPLYALFRRTQTASAAFLSAALWGGVPAVAVFLPKSDAAYPFLATVIVWLAISCWDRPGIIRGTIFGIACWSGLMASLAFLPVIAFCIAVCGLDLWQQRRIAGAMLRTRARVLVSASAGFAAPIFALWFATGLNLIVVWSWNYRNHAAFYGQYTRTYAAWLAINPVELAFAVGWPLMGAALWTVGQWLVSRSHSDDVMADVPRQASHRYQALAAGLGIGGLLWLSGKNSGEAARLWLLLMPGIVWLAAHFPQPEQSHRPATGHLPLLRQLGLLAISLLACLATVHRVGGFHL